MTWMRVVISVVVRGVDDDIVRGVAGGGGSWGARDPPLVGLLLRKQPTIFRWQKRHDNILAA